MSWSFDRAQAQYDNATPEYLEEGYAGDIEEYDDPADWDEDEDR